METTGQTENSGSTYKKSWGKWVALYLAIGAIAYFIIYLVASTTGAAAAEAAAGTRFRRGVSHLRAIIRA